MELRRGVRRVQGIFAVIALGVAPAALAQPLFPPAGADAFESSMEVVLTALSQTRTVPLRGPTAVLRSEPRTGDDGHRVIDTELVGLDLRGTDAVFGDIRVQLAPDRSSTGAVRAQGTSDDFPADSHFDVYVRVTVPGVPGDLVNLQPVRVEAQNLQKLPPIFDTYQHPPPAIPLVLASNPGVVVAEIGGGSTHRPEQLPTFSVAPGGSIDAADLLAIGNPPAVRLSRASLGLQAGDDVDALSFGRDAFVPGQTTVAFSVDPASDGAPGSAVAQQAALAEAQGDEFVSYLAQSNQLLVDEQALVLAPSADLDALTDQDARAVDADDDGSAERPVFFTLAAGSPSLASLAASAGDVLVSVNGSVSIYATRAALGLVPGDAVDALCLQKAGLPFTTLRAGSGPPGPPAGIGAANFDHALFSLAPGSPSLAAQGFSAADLLVTDFSASRPNLAGAPPAVFARAADLGLLASDDVDALKCLSPVSFVEVDGGGDTDGGDGTTGCEDTEIGVAAGVDTGLGAHSGNHLTPPAPFGELDFFELWSIQNPAAGDYHGPYAYPDTEAADFFVSGDPADVAFVGGPFDNCGLPHVHGGLFGFPGDKFGLHQDLDPGACGHGVYVPMPLPIYVIPTRRSNIPVFTQEFAEYADLSSGGLFTVYWHLYNQRSNLPLSACLSPNHKRTVLVFLGLSLVQANAFGFGPLLPGANFQPRSLPTGPGLARTESPARLGDPVAVLPVPLNTPEPSATLMGVIAAVALGAARRAVQMRSRPAATGR